MNKENKEILLNKRSREYLITVSPIVLSEFFNSLYDVIDDIEKMTMFKLPHHKDTNSFGIYITFKKVESFLWVRDRFKNCHIEKVPISQGGTNLFDFTSDEIKYLLQSLVNYKKQQVELIDIILKVNCSEDYLKVVFKQLNYADDLILKLENYISNSCNKQ